MKLEDKRSLTCYSDIDSLAVKMIKSEVAFTQATFNSLVLQASTLSGFSLLEPQSSLKMCSGLPFQHF